MPGLSGRSCCTVIGPGASTSGDGAMSLVIVYGLSWQDRARCVGAGLDLFFPDGNDAHRAKAFCARCPVWAECLAYGFDEEHGVWGGLNRGERGRLRRLCARLVLAPDDPGNAKDIRLLVGAGVAPESLSVLTGVPAEEIAEMAHPRRRRTAAVR
jgi:WhiB family transcriptional regulator, redox-sensing transcriptional regulator